MTEIKQIPCGMVNTYLLKGKNGAVLVDTGETADREKYSRHVKMKTSGSSC